jgi:predicted amino acid-binding ACT domain protein
MGHPIWLKKAKSGTLISFEEDEKMEQAVVSGIAFTRDEAKITVVGVPDTPGIAYQILGKVAEANVDVDVIIQNVSHDGKTDFSFTVHSQRLRASTVELLKSAMCCQHWVQRDVVGDTKICKVSRSWASACAATPGIASTMFKTLSDEGINIQMITTSEIKTSVVIDEKYLELAVRALHKAFGLEDACCLIVRCFRTQLAMSSPKFWAIMRAVCWRRDRVVEGTPLLREYTWAKAVSRVRIPPSPPKIEPQVIRHLGFFLLCVRADRTTMFKNLTVYRMGPDWTATAAEIEAEWTKDVSSSAGPLSRSPWAGSSRVAKPMRPSSKWSTARSCSS